MFRNELSDHVARVLERRQFIPIQRIVAINIHLLVLTMCDAPKRLIAKSTRMFRNELSDHVDKHEFRLNDFYF